MAKKSKARKSIVTPQAVEDNCSTKKSGRPAGSRNIPRDEVEIVVSRCKACNSTNRTKYGTPVVQEARGGVDPNGKPFTHMIARPTQCKDCGQHRRDIAYMFDPEANSSDVEQAMQGESTTEQ